MNRRNAYLARREANAQARLGRELQIHCQIGADAAAIAANEVFHMGPTRSVAFHRAYQQAYLEIVDAINEDSDLAFARLDRRLSRIFGDGFVPHGERYGGTGGNKPC